MMSNWRTNRKTRQRFFHASPRRLPSVLPPTGYYEKVEDGEVKMWYPVGNEAPIFPISQTPESAFSKTPGGAVLGSASSARSPGTVYVYETEEKPDVDISDESSDWADFDVTEEVRYRRPVNVRLLGTTKLTEKDIEKVNEAYSNENPETGDEYPPNKAALRRLARDFSRRVRQ